MIESEMKERLQKFKGMTLQEEAALLSLSEEQKKIVMENDKKLKNEFLAAPPHITHGAVKMNEKYKAYVTMAHAHSR
jgi:hypothetical protein